MNNVKQYRGQRSTKITSQFNLHPWPEKRDTSGLIGKMKADTVARLDAAWSSYGEILTDMKVSDHVKECKRCGSLFSPGTSHQQLLTHSRKCDLRLSAIELGENPREYRVDPTSFEHQRITPDLPTDPMPTLPRLIGTIDHSTFDPLLSRLTDLSIKERDTHHMAQRIMEASRGTSRGGAAESVRRTVELLKIYQEGIRGVRTAYREAGQMMGRTDALLDFRAASADAVGVPTLPFPTLGFDSLRLMAAG